MAAQTHSGWPGRYEDYPPAQIRGREDYRVHVLLVLAALASQFPMVLAAFSVSFGSNSTSQFRSQFRIDSACQAKDTYKSAIEFPILQANDASRRCH